MLDQSKPGWWKNAVIYQIYPRSFQDTNGDGIGDLPGVISRLDYLAQLGVDGIWLSPVYVSPQVDNGYDVADYRDIDPIFGSMADMERLIREARERGIAVIMDLVLNHSSDRHFWFQEALKSRDNPYHDYYIFRDGTPDCPPNGLTACFGGSAWTWVPELGQYYFHQFAPGQPDLNWENPVLRRELYDMILFWMDKGVKGFRLDVIDGIAKEPDRGVTTRGPRLHDLLRELSRESFQHGALLTVGEAWSSSMEEARRYGAADGSELSMVFVFEPMTLDQDGSKWDVKPLSLPALKACYDKWQRGLGDQGWNTLFLENHDLPRIVSRWGDDGAYRVESAKMLATMMYAMRGTSYLYQGQELGMTNVRLPIQAYNDLEIQNTYQEQLAQGRDPEDIMASIYAMGRDNARTPMQWSDAPNAGFTEGTPWLPVNENYHTVNARAALEDPDSVFHYYQALIALRRRYPVFQDGSFTLLDPEDEELFCYRRDTRDEHLLVVCNFTGRTVPYACPEAFAAARTLLSNNTDAAPALRPNEARIRNLGGSD